MSPASQPAPVRDAALADGLDKIGAHVQPGGGVSYRMWAPDHRDVRVLVEHDAGPRTIALVSQENGYFGGVDAAGLAGDRYRFLPDGADQPLPDPASRFQPDGVFGPSEVIDPAAYAWRDCAWRRPPLRGRVLHELHVGAFTPEGTFRSAVAKLDLLVDLGVNTLQLMPVADFAGRRNWGYDGVMLFAPARCYGRPDDLRALIDAAHERGLAIVLDVVYNHLGAVGNVLPRFASAYFHEEKKSLWGRALNFDRDAAPVRDFFLQNVRHWLDEYRVDGLRLDAVHAIHDESPVHIVAEIAKTAHERGAFVIAEDERNLAQIITPAEEGGWGLDAVWADDFHHAARVSLTGQRETYFASYNGDMDELARTLRRGWLYEGQHCPHKNAPRGTRADHRPPEQFVHCISNHDQVGNRPLGERLNASVAPEAYRALSMLLCLEPGTPLLFMGQEWAAGTPFVFFTDLPGKIGDDMADNRRAEFRHYGANYDAETLDKMPDPQSDAAFESSKLDWSELERAPHRGVRELYRACLALRRDEAIFQSAPRERWTVNTSGENLLGLRWKHPDGDWLLLVGVAPGRAVAAEEARLKNTDGKRWLLVLASNAPAFGGELREPELLPPHGANLAVDLPGAILLRETASPAAS